MKIYNFLPSLYFYRKNIKVIFFVFFIYFYFLITSLPANVVFSFIKLPNNIEVSSLSGTLWSGKARQARISSVELGIVEWSVQPFNILLGKLTADVVIKNRDQYISSEISINPSGKITLENTSFKIKMSSFSPLTYGMPVAYDGIASGYFPLSFFYKNNYVGVNGKLSLSGIELISPQRQYFGDFVVDFRAEKAGASSGKIKDVAGALVVDGIITVNKMGLFKLSTKISARETGSPIDNMLSFFGKKDINGKILLNNSIRLW